MISSPSAKLRALHRLPAGCSGLDCSKLLLVTPAMTAGLNTVHLTTSANRMERTSRSLILHQLIRYALVLLKCSRVDLLLILFFGAEQSIDVSSKDGFQSSTALQCTSIGFLQSNSISPNNGTLSSSFYFAMSFDFFPQCPFQQNLGSINFIARNLLVGIQNVVVGIVG